MCCIELTSVLDGVVRRFQILQCYSYYFCRQMAGPTDGSCNTDTFSVSGQNTNAPVPTLCGQNTGQHGQYRNNW